MLTPPPNQSSTDQDHEDWRIRFCVCFFIYLFFFCLVNISDKSPPPVPSHSNRCYVPVCETTTSQLQISVIYRKIKENPDYAMHFFKNQSIFNHRFGCRQVINIQSCMSLCVHKSWPYNNKIFDDVLETKNVKKVKMLLIYTCIPFLICATTGHW